MSKIAVVAASEFGTAIRSKGFIIGIIMAPLMMTISIVVQVLTETHVDVTERAFVVIDHSAKFGPTIVQAAAARDQEIKVGGKEPKARFVPTLGAPGEKSLPELKLELSDRIRRHEIFAFVEIPAGIAEPAAGPRPRFVYYSDTPSYRDLSEWLEGVINAEAKRLRYAAEGIQDPVKIERLEARVGTDRRGLEVRSPTGEIQEAAPIDMMRTFVIPAVLMAMMFFIVMSSSPQLLNGVLEEKMSRISEVLMGSVTPFELMMGKLLGSVGISGVLATVYLGGGYGLAAYHGYADAVPPAMIGWFVLFLGLAVFLFGSMFIAIGSACTELKDAQALMTPAMVLVVLPMLAWSAILKSPDSTFSVMLSLFPPATPTLMLLRLALQPAPPWWQVALGVALCAGTTILFVWAAGKIFRTGILMQGKSANFREMLRWVVAR